MYFKNMEFYSFVYVRKIVIVAWLITFALSFFPLEFTSVLFSLIQYIRWNPIKRTQTCFPRRNIFSVLFYNIAFYFVAL